MSGVPTVAFHVHVAEPLAYALRVLHKARAQELTVQVMLEPGQAAELSRRLWEQPGAAFWPHALLKQRPSETQAKRTPVWLDESGAHGTHAAVVLNVSGRLVSESKALQKVIEIVSADALALSDARSRWRLYAARGWSPVLHEASSGSSRPR